MLQSKIKNFSYKKCWKEALPQCDFKDINELPSKALITFENKIFACSKWVSPKRTRSYPYARVYDTFDCGKANKIVTIIPLLKDEGLMGDMDYLQWDTLSLMSLLNVYVIIGYYDEAEAHSTRENKITNQKFNNAYIISQLNNLVNYHQSALHWNLNQLENTNLLKLTKLAKNAYQNIAQNLNISLHNPQNNDKWTQKILQSKNTFMEFSRTKAQQAQNRESLTIQPKEQINSENKAKIMIENYLGGQYFFTCDEVFEKEGVLHLCENKHSKNALLPSSDDIKDGLLKLMLYNNIDSIDGYTSFKIVLKLTSSILQADFALPHKNLAQIFKDNDFSLKEQSILQALNTESLKNNFVIWINNAK